MCNKLIIEDGLSTIRKTGVGHYTVALEERLKESGIPFEHINKDYLVQIKNVKIRRLFYTLWLNIILPLKLIFTKGKKTIIFTNTNTPLIKVFNVEYIPIIHDLRPFKVPELSASKFMNEYEKRKVVKAAQRGNRFITVSDTVKNAITEYFKIPSEKIFVINSMIFPHFYSYDDNFEILKNYNLSDKEYFLTVSTRQKWKNMPLIIEAYKNISKIYPDIKLVLVGQAGNDNYFEENKNIIFTGYVEDKVIPVLYKHSLAYISASADEGFGSPIIEAQYSETPVLCSDIPIYREVTGNAALFFDINAQSIYAKMEQIINDKSKRLLLIEQGKNNINRFSKEVIKKQINAILKF